MNILGQSGKAACAGGILCQGTPVPCPSSGNLQNGCLYAQANGFTVAAGGRQNVTLASGLGPSAPTAPGVAVEYWVTGRVSERIPQLFSAVLGNVESTASARATAAVVATVVEGSVRLLNRQNDTSPLGTGVNLSATGNASVISSGGILLASTYSSAGQLQGTSSVTAPYTLIRGAGNVDDPHGAWQTTPANQQPDGPSFLDPMRGFGQPPLTTSVLTERRVLGGAIAGGPVDDPTVLQPGNYYTTAKVKCGPNCFQEVATGDPVRLGAGYFRFVNNGFGDYVFFGGVSTASGSTNVTFAPGRYVFAGRNAAGAPLFEVDNQTTLQDGTASAGRNSDAGEVLIFTDANYPGLDIQIQSLPMLNAIKGQLQHGTAGFQAGNNPASQINLHGLNADNGSLPEELKPFAPAVLWQDQANSRVKYTASGDIDLNSCGSGHAIDNPCTNTLANNQSPTLYLQATPHAHLYGLVYQPRGAWTTLQGGGGYSGPMQLVSGAINLQGGPDLTLLGISNPLKRRSVALVE